jgi:hypothetical protein
MGYDDNGSDSAMLILKIAVMFLIGIVLFINIGGLNSANKTNSVTLEFTKNPQSHETIQLGNNVYEFSNDNNVTSDHIPVHLGITLNDTVSNFKNATSANYDVA